MKRVARFEKVSFEQFNADFADCVNSEIVMDSTEAFENVVIPRRATAGSAGYDIVSPVPFRLEPGESIRIPTGLRIKMEPGWVLLALPKSGLGIKYRFQLDNTCGVIDSDYYNARNEGHILISMTNDSKSGKVLEFPAGKAFVQTILIPYGITYDDEADGERTGGFGSTDA